MRVLESFSVGGMVLSDAACAARIDDWLRQWHAWCRRDPYANGYYGVSPGCIHARTSRQYDDFNGNLDVHIDAVEMEAADAIVNAMADPWRTALSVQARNLYTGSMVWSSPRLPACPMERQLVLGQARKKFQEALIRAGIF
ncbi:hypothetical protein [Macromonas nakdongensis]|uniref:hypothetical protein n=1 Tax=Macromonas nakdongensis TaxID=1843082 RepID=UPI000C3286F9|nr:hypothetical protein [Macromonas nakdongensis]